MHPVPSIPHAPARQHDAVSALLSLPSSPFPSPKKPKYSEAAIPMSPLRQPRGVLLSSPSPVSKLMGDASLWRGAQTQPLSAAALACPPLGMASPGLRRNASCKEAAESLLGQGPPSASSDASSAFGSGGSLGTSLAVSVMPSPWKPDQCSLFMSPAPPVPDFRAPVRMPPAMPSFQSPSAAAAASSSAAAAEPAALLPAAPEAAAAAPPPPPSTSSSSSSSFSSASSGDRLRASSIFCTETDGGSKGADSDEDDGGQPWVSVTMRGEYTAVDFAQFNTGLRLVNAHLASPGKKTRFGDAPAAPPRAAAAGGAAAAAAAAAGSSARRPRAAPTSQPDPAGRRAVRGRGGGSSSSSRRRAPAAASAGHRGAAFKQVLDAAESLHGGGGGTSDEALLVKNNLFGADDAGAAALLGSFGGQKRGRGAWAGGGGRYGADSDSDDGASPRGAAPAAAPRRRPAAAPAAAPAKARGGGSNKGGRRTCTCKNSRCLKLYCDCFAMSRTCDGCGCHDCHNRSAADPVRKKAVAAVLAKNPEAFRAKIGGGEHSAGCKCKKSRCLKKYCECFEAGITCGDRCKCEDCQNFAGSAALQDRKKRVQSRSGSAGGARVRVQSPPATAAKVQGSRVSKRRRVGEAAAPVAVAAGGGGGRRR